MGTCKSDDLPPALAQTPRHGSGAIPAASLCEELLSSEKVVDHPAAHIRKPEIAAGIAIGKFLVIEAKQVKQRRVQIVYVDHVLNGCEAELIRCAVRDAFLQSCTRKPHRETIRVVIA